MHSFTEAQRRKGPDGLPEAPYAEDTEGGGKHVNRCDSFMTVHRKIQSGDHEVRKTTELHIRKVRNKETGGEPTPHDEPVMLTMGTGATSFSIKGEGTLFSPITTEFDDYETYEKIPTNLDFFQKKSYLPVNEEKP